MRSPEDVANEALDMTPDGLYSVKWCKRRERAADLIRADRAATLRWAAAKWDDDYRRMTSHATTRAVLHGLADEVERDDA